MYNSCLIGRGIISLVLQNNFEFLSLEKESYIFLVFRAQVSSSGKFSHRKGVNSYFDFPNIAIYILYL